MSKLTVKELIDQLRVFPDDAEVSFQYGITLYKITERGGSESDRIANIEFNENIHVISDD